MTGVGRIGKEGQCAFGSGLKRGQSMDQARAVAPELSTEGLGDIGKTVCFFCHGAFSQLHQKPRHPSAKDAWGDDL